VLGWQGVDTLQTDDLVSARRQTVYGTKEPETELEGAGKSDFQEAT
jgi:hypothetical protein